MAILVDEARSVSEGSRTDPRDPMSRLAQLLDGSSSGVSTAQIAPLPGDSCGVVAVRGRVRGAPVIAYCTDGRQAGGSLGPREAGRIVAAIELALRQRVPVVGLWHSGGARLGDGVASLDAVGGMFAAMTRASGRIPQISLVLGPAAGAAAYGPALTDLVVMAEAGRVFVTGPDVVHSVTGERVDMEQLGGADAHGRRSGVAHVTAVSEAQAYEHTRALTTLLAKPGRFDQELAAADQPLAQLLPDSSRRAYDVRPLVAAILDAGSIQELHPRWAPNVVTGLGRLAGRTVGVLANNPLRLGGCLDSLSAEKASRFVRMCDCFGVPLLVVVDVPGYLPGVGQEWGGVVRRGAKLLHAFAEASVPRVTLITRKAYGGAYVAMNSKALGASAVLAWPQAEVAVMGPEAAVGILHRRELAAAGDGPEHERLRQRLVAQQSGLSGVRHATGIGVVDAVIAPEHTRRLVVQALAAAPPGRGRHGNIPL